jgi:hypothetical protein
LETTQKTTQSIRSGVHRQSGDTSQGKA